MTKAKELKDEVFEIMCNAVDFSDDYSMAKLRAYTESVIQDFMEYHLTLKDSERGYLPTKFTNELFKEETK